MFWAEGTFLWCLGKEIARVMQLVGLLTWVIVQLLVLFMKTCLMESCLKSPVKKTKQRDQCLSSFVFFSYLLSSWSNECWSRFVKESSSPRLEWIQFGVNPVGAIVCKKKVKMSFC
jgi:hypothetical protein